MPQAGTQAALGLTAAAAWGGGDFAGGIAAKGAAPTLVVAVAHGFSLLLLVAAAALLQLSYAGHGVFGLGSGILCGGGLIALYSALARGSMGLTAAISGVLTAVVPVLYSLAQEALSVERRPSVVRLAGFAVAAAAIWLVAYVPTERSASPAMGGRAGGVDVRNVGLAVAAGLSFGGMLILMHRAASYGVLQALIEMRLMSVSIAAVAGVFVWLARRGAGAEWRGIPAGKILLLAMVAGVLDTTGNLLYLFAARVGRLDVTAVLSSLYPAGTMLLAAGLLKERTTKSQAAGMALAIAAIFLISI